MHASRRTRAVAMDNHARRLRDFGRSAIIAFSLIPSPFTMVNDSGQNVGEFTNDWFELSIVNEELIKRLLAPRDPDDDNAEHLRYAAFKHFVAGNRPLPKELCWKLYNLGCADGDFAMGGAMMADVLRLHECPIDLLTRALSSNRKHVARIAASRLDSVH